MNAIEIVYSILKLNLLKIVYVMVFYRKFTYKKVWFVSTIATLNEMCQYIKSIVRESFIVTGHLITELYVINFINVLKIIIKIL